MANRYDQENGVVVPFALSVQRLRRKAAEYRRNGQLIEALQLLRQVCERDARLNVRMELAECMMALGNDEQAAAMLRRILSYADAPLYGWLLLARCQSAMGLGDAAQDSLYHYLEADASSAAADEARSMLAQLTDGTAQHEPFRLQKLQQRALDAWADGQKTLSEKRFRRAARISLQPARYHALLGMHMLSANDNAGAYKYLTAALRREPNDPRTNTALCLALAGLDRMEEAQLQLQRCAQLCTEPSAELLYTSAARALGCYEAAVAYLQDRLRRKPYRITLLHELAQVLCRIRRTDEACSLYQRILQADPGDQRARIQLELLTNSEERRSFPALLKQRKAEVLDAALTNGDPAQSCADQLLQPGSASRQMLDWVFEHDEPAYQYSALKLLLACIKPEDELAVPYLRELLTLSTLRAELAQMLLVRLHELGYTEPTPVAMGLRIGQARSAANDEQPNLWPVFLGRFLHETRRHDQSLPMACCAADWWRELTPAQQAHAAGDQIDAYIKAMELLYLRCTGQTDSEQQVIHALHTSKRRISRILRRLDPGAEPVKGEDRHEMYRL